MLWRRIFRTVWALFTVAAALTALVGPARAQPPAAAADPVASPGCTDPAPAPGQSVRYFSAGAGSGLYIQDIPTAPDHPAPVVLDLHGYLESPVLEQRDTGVGAFGDSHGFVTITPQLGESPTPVWDLDENSAAFGYLSDLLTHLESTLCLDERRIYATGLSMGGTAAMAVACRLSTRIAAVAPVAGLEDFPWCHPPRPVSVVAFHGTADPFLSYNGGLGPLLRNTPGLTVTQPLPSIPDNAAAWAQHDKCGPHPTDHQIATDVTLRTYPCPANTAVALYTVIGGGHTWPGTPSELYPPALVGPSTNSINATAIMWAFFQSHPLTGPIGN